MNFLSAVVGVGLIAASITAYPTPVGAHGPPAVAETLDTLPLLAEILPDAVQVSPHVPNMGAHWAKPGTPQEGPFYCVIQGRVVCVEYMFEASQLAEGTQWQGLLPGLKTPPVSPHRCRAFAPGHSPPRSATLPGAPLFRRPAPPGRLRLPGGQVLAKASRSFLLSCLSRSCRRERPDGGRQGSVSF